ncbi:MAG: MFS transporter [Pseudomonadota bacterium]
MAGFYRTNARWLGAGFALSFASSFGQTFFIALFAGDIRAAYGLTHGEWGTLYTAATLASAAVLFGAGALTDTLRLDRLVLCIAALYAACLLGMGLAETNVWLLGLLVFGLRFCGQGMMSHIAITAMGRWFRTHRGRAIAIASLGFSAGEALLPSLAVGLALWIGWRETWMVAAGVVALVLAPFLAWSLSQRRQPRGAAQLEEAPGLGARHWNRRAVLGHWGFWALLPGVLTPSFIGTVLFFQQVHLASIKDWDLTAMALGYPVYAGLAVTASLSGGWIVDRVGARQLLPVFALPLGLAVALIGAGSDVGVWYLGLALMGVAQGTAHALWGALWPELYGTRHLGSLRAMATTAMVFSTAIGPGLSGALIDAGFDLAEQTPAMAVWCLVLSVAYVGVLRALKREALAPG